MQETEVIYEVPAANFMLTPTGRALNYFGHCGETHQ